MKKFKSRWKWITVTIFILTVLLAVSWQLIFSRGLGIFLSHALSNASGRHFKYNQIYHEKENWVIDSPRLYLNEDEDCLIFKSSRAILNYTLDLWHGQIDLYITLDEPEFKLHKKDSDFVAELNQEGSDHFFQWNKFIAIRNGSLDVEGYSYDIQGDIFLGNSYQGHLNINFKDHQIQEFETSLNNHLYVDFIRDPSSNWQIDFQSQKVDCFHLHRLASSIFSTGDDIIIKDGIFDGVGGLILKRKNRPVFYAEASLVRLKFEHVPTKIKGLLQEVRFHLQKNSDTNSLSYGSIIFCGDETLTYTSENARESEIRNMLGGIYVDDQSQSKIVLHGIYDHFGQTHHLSINGEASFPPQKEAFLKLDWMLEDSQWQSSGCLKLNEVSEKQYEMQLDLNQLRFQDTVALQSMLHSLFPNFIDVELEEGIVNLSATAHFNQKKLAQLTFDLVELKDLKAHYLPWYNSWTAERVSGRASFDFESNKVNSTEIILQCEDGKISSLTDLWQIDNIQANLLVSQNLIVHAHAKGNYGEMVVALDCDSLERDTVKVEMKGKLHEIVRLIPDLTLRERLMSVWAEDQLMVTADVKQLENAQEVIGLAKFTDSHNEEKVLAFGFEFSKNSNCAQNYFESFQTLVPQDILSCIHLNEFRRFKEKTGFHLNDGWFLVDNLPLEKYLAPFFLDDTMTLSGSGNFQGKFDDQTLLLTYDTQEILLENDSFAIEAAEIKQTGTKPLHYIDFAKGLHVGFLPIENGSYLEKNCKLLFSDISAYILFEGANIHIPSIETFCQGIYMAGSIEMNLQGLFDSKPNNHELTEGHIESSKFLENGLTSSIDIRMQSLHGKVSQIQNFFSHLPKPLFFLKVPIEGDVTMHQDAGHLLFNFFPNTYDMQIHLKGALSEGTMKVGYADVALQELSLAFEYDYQKNILDFSEIQGTLLVGEPESVEEYQVVGEKIFFADYLQNRSSFDVWIGDKKRDIIRLAGETFSPSGKPNDIQFVLDHQLSHFGNVHPGTFHLILQDWWQIQEFDLIANFKLASLFKDLQRFSRSGFLSLSRHFLKKINNVKKAEGVCNVQIKYDGAESKLFYKASGEEIIVDDYHFKKIALEGKKADEMWMIDQLIIDDVSIAANILRKQGSWFINFMGLQIGKSVLMGLQGEYFDDSHRIEGKINLLEVDFLALKSWPRGADFLQKYPFQGFFKASGQFHWQGSEEAEWGQLDTLMTASFKNLKIKNLQFEDIFHTSIHYTSDRGVIGRQIKTAIVSDGSKKADLSLDKVEYDLKQETFNLENLNFIIPVSEVTETLDEVFNSFPYLFKDYNSSIFAQLKQGGYLEGSLNFDYADPHYGIKLILKDGDYQLFNKKMYLSNFSLEYDPCEVYVMTKCLDQAFPFWLHYKSSFSNFKKGELFITDDSTINLAENPLIIQCQYDTQGFSIDEVKGKFHEITFNLTKDDIKKSTPQAYFLTGEVRFNAKNAASLLSRDLGEKFGIWQIGDGYSLKGCWEFIPSSLRSEGYKTYFKGHLEGQNYVFKGYQWKHLQAEMHLTPEQVFFKDMSVRDPSLNLDINDLRFMNNQDTDAWKVNLSKANVHEFKPNLLRKLELPAIENQKNLVLKDLIVEGVQGTLGKPESFVGKGSLLFVNAPQKNTTHPLFAIPGEILTHLGLDLSVLNPVIGTIYYEIKDSKIYLTKLKDSYSQGKMSKFYLPNHSFHQSYVDFDGNLNVQIKMKHNNLIFKLAEFFTVTIQGNLQKPTYSLQKQKK